jgi:hypothetical protein
MQAERMTRCMRVARGQIDSWAMHLLTYAIIVHALCCTRWPSLFASRALREYAPRVTARCDGCWGGLDAGPTSACTAPAQVRQWSRGFAR